MSGMIWSALGGAVANAGNTIGGMMMRDIEDQRRREEEDRKEANYIKRLEEADRIKSERDTAREEALQQRVIRESKEAQTRAGEIRSAREEQQLTQDAERLARASASIEGSAPSTSAEQFKQMLKDNPKLRDLYAGTGVIGRSLTEDQQRLQASSDLSQAAMEIGAHSSVIRAYQADREATLKEIREKNVEEGRKADRDRAERAEDRRTQEARDRATYQDRMAGAAEKRADRVASNQNNPDKPATTADLQRQITAAQNSLASELGVSKNDVNAEVASIKRKADRGDAKAKERLDTIQPFLDELKDANDRMLQFKRAKPSENTPTASPAPGNNPPGNRRPLDSFLTR